MDMAIEPPIRYVGSPKHKRGPSRGRRGSLCPGEIDAAKAQRLLERSIPVPHEGVNSKRYCTDGSRAFCAHCHDISQNEWHGFPVGWHEVPPAVRHRWLQDGTIKAKVLRRRAEGS
jgi:hypothetical protein